MIKRKKHINLSSYINKIDKDGNKLCLNCDIIIIGKRRKRYCSKECADEFYVKNDHHSLKLKLFRERKGTCAHCEIIFKRVYEMILDHIKPIAIGGAEFDEDNLQLLCKSCDKIKTANDIKTIAVARRIEANDSRGQMNFMVR